MPTISLPNGMKIHLPYENDSGRFDELAEKVAGQKPNKRRKSIHDYMKTRSGQQAVRANIDQIRYRSR